MRMVENSLTFLTAIEVPEFCFLSEAVEWVALGRVPQANWTEDQITYDRVESRFYWYEMPDNLFSYRSDPYIDRFEFEAFGVPIPSQYYEAINRCFDEDVWGLPARISEYSAKEPMMVDGGNDTEYDFWSKILSDQRALLAELAPMKAIVDGVEDRFRVHYDLAWAKLFQLIVQGDIRCSGVDMKRWERLAENDEHELAARFDDIPPSAFTLNHHWKENKLKIEGTDFAGVRIRTGDIIKRRQVLLPVGKLRNLEQMGSFFALTSEGVSETPSRRGRPRHLNWGLLKEFLGEMMRNKNLPENKESCIYELIIYAERELSKSPSRSSIQRNLKIELNAAYPDK